MSDDLEQRLRTQAEHDFGSDKAQHVNWAAAERMKQYREALEAIANDPYQRGQRVQAMKRTARKALQVQS